MAKIVFIGAGSHAFSRLLVTDILSFPELRDSTITLMDIAEEPLGLITAFTKKLVKQQGFNTVVQSTMDRREALEGANYVFVTIMVGKPRTLQAYPEITSKYGIEGSHDTIGPSGIFYGLRHVPVILDICHDMEELCPDAWLLSYANPMAIICWAVNDYTRIKNVGLCHSIPHTTVELANYFGVPKEEISSWVAGINHMAWFLKLNLRGKDAYPLLREKFKDPALYSRPNAHWGGPDIVRAEVLKAFGYFVSEGSPHMATLIPYFKKRPELIERFKVDDNKFEQPAARRAREDKELKQQINSDYMFPVNRSDEYGPIIIHSIETGVPSRVCTNVKNTSLITNLPDGCCVEVPCLVDREGVHPCYVGDLPPQLAGLNRTNINVPEMAVRGIVEKDKTKIFKSLLLDPLTSAILTIDETRQMAEELFQVSSEYLRDFN